MKTVHVTYETTTEESTQAGDLDDHGFMSPSEYRVSLGNAQGKRYTKRVRAAQRGRYDWTLGDAVRFVRGKMTGSTATVNVDICMGEPGWCLTVYVDRFQEDEGSAEAVGYGLHIEHISEGTADRLCRLFEAAGARQN